jgi:hypothetical protein
MSEFLTFDQIVGADDIKEEEVDVPAWGGKVLLREMTAGARDWFEGSMVTEAAEATNKSVDKSGNILSMDNFRVKLVAASMVDPSTKKRIFDTNEQVEALAQKSGTALVEVADVALRLNNMTEAEVKSLGEDLRRAQEDASTSDSPEPSESPSESSSESSQEPK